MMLRLSLGRKTDKLKAVILICWLLPAEGGHLPGKRRSSVWVAQQDGTTARTSIEQLNLSFKGKSKRAWVSCRILRTMFCSIKCIRVFYCMDCCDILHWINQQCIVLSFLKILFSPSITAIDWNKSNSLSDWFCVMSSVAIICCEPDYQLQKSIFLQKN